MIKGKALDSGSYPSLFNASRIPVKPADTFKRYDPSGNDHVVVLRKNRYYKVNAKGLSVDQLDQAMQDVVRRADKAGEGLGVGSLTAHDRDSWTDVSDWFHKANIHASSGTNLCPINKAREHLISLSPKNAKALEAIESSILLICLDDRTAAQGRDARSWSLYTGDGQPSRNRWFDKHEFVVDANGESGFNGERKF
jgi:carnitine O-acetyltransferase